jgi:hypothetical protein
MQITLTPEIENVLTQRANKIGTTPERLALEVLRQHLSEMRESEEQPSSQRTLAEFLGDQIGSIATGDYVPGGANLSEQTGQRFAAALLKKHQKNQQ